MTRKKANLDREYNFIIRTLLLEGCIHEGTLLDIVQVAEMADARFVWYREVKGKPMLFFSVETHEQGILENGDFILFGLCLLVVYCPVEKYHKFLVYDLLQDRDNVNIDYTDSSKSHFGENTKILLVSKLPQVMVDLAVKELAKKVQ